MSTSTAQTSLSTPTKPAAAAVPESPGTWRHPRLEEISRRQESSSFTERNAKRVVVNLTVFLSLIIFHTVLSNILPPKRTFPYEVWYYANNVYWLLLALPLINVGTNLLPLMRRQDDLSDIPLTPGQRRLLGLPPSSAPPTPGSAYSTPPRYSRTPSISGSAGSRRSFSSPGGSNAHSPSASSYGSPANGSGSLLGVGGGSILASPGSPLLHKAVKGARRSSFSSSFSSLGSSTATGASVFGGAPPDSPSPNPAAAAKRSSVSLNSKWLYEKGREHRSSGTSWLYS
ncbi:nuclear pore complex component-domain-containing protein [Biscogniauxia marginata]|nr:nuclear pore complex component-domain-containing protein [Biscogniauxia marginata]